MKAANYHSRTPQYNAVYRADLMRKASKWADWLPMTAVTIPDPDRRQSVRA